MFRCTTFFVILSLSIGGTVAVAAPAEDPEALIKAGNDLRRKGDNKRAEGYFRRAYDLARTARSAAQLGLVELALARYAAAEEHLSEAITSDDSWIQDNREAVEKSRASVRKHLFGIELVGAPPDATVTLAGGRVVKLPGDSVVWVAPGAVTLELQAVGRKSATVNATGAEGERRKVPVELERIATAVPIPPAVPAAEPAGVVTTPPDGAAPPPPPPAAEPSSRLKPVGIAVGAVGVAAGVAGAILFVQGNGKRDRWESPTTAYDPADANWKTFRNAGIGLLAGGSVAIAAGVVTYVMGSRAASSSSAASGTAVGFDVGPGYGSFALRRSF